MTPVPVMMAGQMKINVTVRPMEPTYATNLAPRKARSTSASSGRLSNLLALVKLRSLLSNVNININKT